MVEGKIVTSLYRSLQGHTVYGGCSEPAGRRLSVSKLMAYGNFWNNWRCKLWQLLDILNLARKDTILVTLAH